MGRRSWVCYRLLRVRGYQRKRSRSHRKEYVRGGADPKIRLYDVGNRKKKLADYDVVLGMLSRLPRRYSHLTMEAIRISVNRRLADNAGKEAFHMRVCLHPYMTYREHAMMAFAGADRLSSGMRQSFGRPVGRCVPCKANQLIMMIGVDMKDVELCKEAMRIAGTKVTGGTERVVIYTKNPDDMKRVPLPNIRTFVKYANNVKIVN